MKVTNRLAFLLLCLMHFGLKSGDVFAQESDLITTMENHPDSLELHEAFIEQSKGDIEGLISQYKKWRTEFPKSATIPYAVGKALFYRNHPKARTWFQYTLDVDSSLAEVYMLYGIDAGRWGDYKASTEYLTKASRLEPENAQYAFYAANSYAIYDPDTYKVKMEAMTVDYRGDDRAAMALYWLANKEPDTLQKKRYYQQLAEQYPFEKFGFSRRGMEEYFDLLIDSDLSNAETLAKGIWEQHTDSVWLVRLQDVQKLLRANELLEAGKYSVTLDTLNLLEQSAIASILRKASILKADAFVQQGDHSRSLETLKEYFLNCPDVAIYKKMELLGESNGIGKLQIKDLVKGALLENAKNATDLSGTNYIDQQQIKLSDFRGTTVLLSFWFPTCGPCHAEFPHIEAVLEKARKQQKIAYIGVNIVHQQDDYVVPFVEKSNTTFIPLKDDPEKRGNLTAEAAPSNYLIDKNGKIVFKDFLINGNNRDVLELMFRIIA